MGLAKREELFITTKVCFFLSNFFWDVLGLHFDMAFQHKDFHFVCYFANFHPISIAALEF